MQQFYIEDKTFEKTDFTRGNLPAREFENCVFANCDFSEVDLRKVSFSECEFSTCNLSSAKILDTAFKDVKFVDSKLLGLDFSDCSKFLLAMAFENCVLNFSSFVDLKTKNMIFKNCTMREVDFSGAVLNGAVFDNCDLMKSVFRSTNLEKADLRTAYNFSIDPEFNRLGKAKFSINGLRGLLDKYDIVVE